MKSFKNQKWAPTALSALILVVMLAIWTIATMPEESEVIVDPEYAALVGQAASTGGETPLPTPGDVGEKLWGHISDPFYHTRQVLHRSEPQASLGGGERRSRL